MADDGGQRVVQAQADACCSAGSACNDGRDAVNHLNELGVCTNDTARAQGSSAWVSIRQPRRLRRSAAARRGTRLQGQEEGGDIVRLAWVAVVSERKIACVC